MTVDEFVQSRVLPQYRDVVQLIRRYMREMAPDAKEVFSYGMPCWKGRWIFAFVSQGQKGITLSFVRGHDFEDGYALLKGVGKSARHLKYRSVDKMDKEVLAYYVRQALDLDSK